jgi:hypothetical protein
MKVTPHKVGANIQWKWLGNIIDGKVEEVFMGPIEKEIKGKIIKRNGSVEKPAYLVRSEAGNIALKLHTELL